MQKRKMQSDLNTLLASKDDLIIESSPISVGQKSLTTESDWHLDPLAARPEQQVQRQRRLN